MAEELDIKKCWFHKNHYDIPKKRIEEIQSKCIVISPREIYKIINNMKSNSKGKYTEEQMMGFGFFLINKITKMNDDGKIELGTVYNQEHLIELWKEAGKPAIY